MRHYFCHGFFSNVVKSLCTNISVSQGLCKAFFLNVYTLNLDFPGRLLRPLSPSSSLAALSKDEKICDDNIYVTKIMSFQIQGSSNIFKYNNKNIASCPSHHPSNLALALKAELSMSILGTSNHFVLQFSCFKSFGSVNQLFHSQAFLIV